MPEMRQKTQAKWRRRNRKRKEEETKLRTTRNLKANCLFSLSDWDCDNKDGILLTKYRKQDWVW